jgi:serine/threonine protein kinase
MLTKTPLFPGDDELDQLHKIHKILGNPTERLLQSMIESGHTAMVRSNSGPTPKPMPEKIYTADFEFPPVKPTGLKAAFPPYILSGTSKLRTKPNEHPHHAAKMYPGITPECIDLMDKMLKYDPNARIGSHETLKHSWFDECRMNDHQPTEAEPNRIRAIHEATTSSSTILPRSKPGSEVALVVKVPITKKPVVPPKPPSKPIEVRAKPTLPSLDQVIKSKSKAPPVKQQSIVDAMKSVQIQMSSKTTPQTTTKRT